MSLVLHPAREGWDPLHQDRPTHCSFCALQCALRMRVERATGRVVRVTGRRDFPTTKGLSCVKGQNAHLQIAHSDRLTQPLLRRNGVLREATWEEALDFAAERLTALQSAHGKDSAAMFGGGALTNETVYLLSKFSRLVLKTRNIDYNGRFCMATAASALNAAFGLDRGMPFPLSDLLEAKCILVAGLNVAECFPPVQAFLKRAKKRGAVLLVADPRPTATALLADLHLRVRPGGDLALALALLAEVKKLDAVDWDYLQDRTRGFDETLASVEGLDADWAEPRCGVPAVDIRRAAALLAGPGPTLILTARGVEQQAQGVDQVQAYINLALALGQVGRLGGGFATFTGQGNGQGGREHGQKADQLPGYRSIEDPEDRRVVAERWGVPEADLPRKGLSAQEILQAAEEGTVKALWVVGSNPAVSGANVSRVRRGLERLEFLAVSDFFLSETAQMAHVVFPVLLFAEEEGTMTNIEGRCVLRRKVTEPIGEARSDRWVLGEMAQRMGGGAHFPFRNSEEVFTEFAAVTSGGRADYGGMNYNKLDRNKGLFWPCPSVDHPGTPRLFERRFHHPDGKARLRPVAWHPSSEEPDADYPFRLTTGRLLPQYLSGNQTRRLAPLAAAAPEPFVGVAEETAHGMGIADGIEAWVETRRGRLRLPVKTVPGQEPGTLFIPFHWGGEKSANLLTQETLDPVSKMPEFKNCAARLSVAERTQPC